MRQNYDDYSNAELLAALAAVDERRFPQNKAAIESAIHQRKSSGKWAAEEKKSQEDRAAKLEAQVNFAARSRPGIAWYLIITNGLLFVAVLAVLPNLNGIDLGIFSILSISYTLAAIVGGIALVKNYRWGTNLAIFVLAAQVIKISSHAFSLDILSALRIFISFGNGGMLSVGFDVEQAFQYGIGTGEPFLISVNLFAGWLIYMLVLSKRTLQEYSP